MTTWQTDFGLLTAEEYYDLFGRSRIERAINIILNNYIIGIYIDNIQNRIYYIILSQTFPITGTRHIVEWNGFMHNSQCTCQDFQNRHTICKHIYSVRLNNLL